MYGLMEGIRAGGSDARSDAEMALQRQRLAMQQAQDARAAEQHALNLREGNLRLGGLQRIDQATQALMDLNTQGAQAVQSQTAADDDFEAANRANMQGLPMPAYNPSVYANVKATPGERDFNRAAMGLAAARGDLSQMTALRGEQKKTAISETFKADMARMSKDPAFRQTVYSYFNVEGALPITIKQAPLDKNGKPTGPAIMQITSPDGDPTQTRELKIGAGQEQQILLGVAYMKHGMDEEGLRIIGGVNKDLAKAIDNANENTVKAFNANTQAGARFDQTRINEAELAERARHNKVVESRAAAGAPREVSAANAAKLSALYENWVRADPKDRPAIERQIQILENNISLVDLRRLTPLASRGPAETGGLPLAKRVELIDKIKSNNPKLSYEGAAELLDSMLGGSGNADAVMGQLLTKATEVKRGTAAATKPAGLPKPMSPAEKELAAAQAVLAQYDYVKRSDDPAGYRKAQERVQAAKANAAADTGGYNPAYATGL